MNTYIANLIKMGAFLQKRYAMKDDFSIVEYNGTAPIVQIPVFQSFQGSTINQDTATLQETELIEFEKFTDGKIMYRCAYAPKNNILFIRGKLTEK